MTSILLLFEQWQD